MGWLYMRHNEETGQWYVGRTHHENHHDRSDSQGGGPFAVGMDGKELAVKIEGDKFALSTAETEAIQFMVGFVGRDNLKNKMQVYSPVTGFQWDE